MTLRAVAWDIDGTLVDSEPLHHRALVAVCARYGLTIDPEDQSFVGVHIGDVWARLRPRLPASVEQARWLEELHAYYAAQSDALPPMPGAIETMHALAQAGVSQICVSNSVRAVVDINLRSLGVTGLLSGSLSLDDVAAGKPDPLPYRMAADRLALPPEAVLAVEDSLTGLRSARAAGLRVALVGPEAAQTNDADYALRALTEIPALLGVRPPPEVARGRGRRAKSVCRRVPGRLCQVAGP